MTQQGQGIDEFASTVGATLDFKDDEGSALASEVLLVLFVFGIIGQSGVTDPFHLGMVCNNNTSK